jgi:kanamycin kinase
VFEAPGAERPSGDVPIPVVLASLAGGNPIEAVWRNQLGGLTFRIGADSPSDRYVKWVAAGTPEIDLLAEATRLRWLAGRFPVPGVLDYGAGAEGAWLMTAAIAASSAVEPRWKAEPATAVTAIGVGLRQLHDGVRAEDCPFVWGVEYRLARARQRLEAGEGPEHWHPEHRRLTVEQARARLSVPPAVDRLVVCHGDACAPNSLLSEDGRFAAIVDLGNLGVADRWADLAVAGWSTEWNYGPGLDTLLYDAYGIRPDPDRIAYYRLLWDLA